MAQIAQLGHIGSGPRVDIPVGGMCAWRLPADERCASAARSLLCSVLGKLHLERDMVDDMVLATSELVTNALDHGLRAGPGAPEFPPELWVWARAKPQPQLVVSVFDVCRSTWPEAGPGNLLDEHGRGMGIVGMVADDWGAHASRSWKGQGGIPGKAVWCAFTLPRSWPRNRQTAPPMHAARHITATLTSRGVSAVLRHGRGVSLVSVPLDTDGELNVWVEPGHLSYAADGIRTRRPIIDLHDLTEDLVRRCEEAGANG